MLFSSTIFLMIFLPAVILVYFLLKVEYRNLFLLLASLFFYAWGEPRFVLVIVLSIVINYLFGWLIAKWKKKKAILSKVLLAVGIVANCGLLFYFKYFNFFLDSINSAFGLDFNLLNIILPIGLSFFTFQGISYIVDIYFEKIKPQKSFIKFALFESFFPQIIAGPIIRYVDVQDQIDHRKVTTDDFAYGIRRFVMGLAKKVIVANTLGEVADQIFALPADQNTAAIAWLGAICYSFQIYFDFTGYSDMAIGLARMFGFKFKENFDFPYISKSITEFWRRWHISLSSWFRDYVYIPLGGNRRGNVYFNLLVVFIVTGLWHGAAWNFIIWGLWHGLFIIIERMLKKSSIQWKVPKVISWGYTMLVVVFGWVLFRSPDLSSAVEYIGIMLGFNDATQVGFTVRYFADNMIVTIMLIACIASLPLTKYIRNVVGEYEEHNFFSILVQNIYILILLTISIIFLVNSSYNPFIYFRF